MTMLTFNRSEYGMSGELRRYAGLLLTFAASLKAMEAV